MRKVLIGFAFVLPLGSQVAMACLNISGTYRCNPDDAPGVVMTTQFIHTPEMLSIVDISSSGTKTTTDQFELDGKSHLGAFGIFYSSSCRDNEMLGMTLSTLFIKVRLEYRLTENGLNIFRNGNIFSTCQKINPRD